MKRVFITFILFLLFAGHVISGETEKENTIIPLIGSKAPSFTANSTQGEFSFPIDFGKNWKILFSHPQDFTPVCTTELLELAFLTPEFKKLGVEIAVISVDNLERHNSWIKFLEDVEYKDREKQKVTFPIIEDVQGLVAKKYGMVHLPASSNRDVRGVYIIDPENVVRSIVFYPMEIGRNMNEIVRMVQALQIHDKSMVYTPANWQVGDDVIVPHRPFPLVELEANPERIKREFYSIKNQIWFKRSTKEEVNK